MYNAVLRQCALPADYTVKMFRCQIALYALKNPHKLKRYVDLITTDELSYQGWVRGIQSGRIWGDETVLVTISLMWNISISIVTSKGIQDIYHAEDCPDIVLVWNGESETAKLNPKIQHWTATGL